MQAGRALVALAANNREELEPEVLVDAGLCVATEETQHSPETLVAQLLCDAGAVELALFTSALELDELRKPPRSGAALSPSDSEARARGGTYLPLGTATQGEGPHACNRQDRALRAAG